MSGDLSEHCEAGRVCVLAMSQTRLLAGLLGECHDSALAQLCAGQDKSKLPNAPFRKYQISGPDMSSMVAGWGGTCYSTKPEFNV